MYRLAICGLNRSGQSVSEANLNIFISGANHTCEIVGIVSKNIIMNHHDESAKSNRRRKLFEVLVKRYHKGCNISQLQSEFSEDGIGIVPHVLASINTDY